MSQCKTCNAFVTDAYARVFGDNDDVIDTCRNCRSSRGSIARDSGAVGATEADGDERAGSADDTVLLRDVRDGSGGDESSEGSGDSRDDTASNRFRFGLSAVRNAL